MGVSNPAADTAPFCSVTKAALQTLTSGAITPIQFDTEREDTDGMHDTVTNNTRVTAVKAGIHVVTANVEFAANATGQRQLSVRINGDDARHIADVRGNAAAANVTRYCTVKDVRLAAGDYVEMVALQNSGGNLDVTKVAEYSPEFTVRWVRA